jgi:hypothetical protein
MLRIDKNKKMKCPHCFTVMDERADDYVLGESHITELWTTEGCFECGKEFEARLEDENTVVVDKL